MRKRVICALLSAMVLMFLPGCGGDGGSGSGAGSGSGTVSMDITDAKPLVVDDPTELWVTIEEVLVHKSGGGWVSLPLPETPLEINLLAYYDNSTELVPPTELVAGHYTQIRIVISKAEMVFDDDGGQVVLPIDLEIPSGFLRTDKQFDFEVAYREAVDITIDFDLSQSIKKTGDDEYKMKPVLHIMETERAATIRGDINAVSFDGFADGTVVVTVIWDKNGNQIYDTDVDETYTKVWVTREPDTDPIELRIFWLVPDQSYIVDFDTDGDEDPNHTEFVPTDPLLDSLGPGDTADLGLIPI